MRPLKIRSVFLEALSQSGCVTVAALAANVSRATVYAWKAADPAFAEAWEEALALGLAGLEDRATELAMEGNEKMLTFLLSSRRPEIYGQKAQLEVRSTVTMALRNASIDELRAELASLLGLGVTMSPLTIDAVSDQC